MRNLLSNSIALAALLAVSAGVSARADVVRIISQPMVVPGVRTLVVPMRRVILPPATITRTRTFQMVMPSSSAVTTTTLPAVVPEPVTTTSTTTVTETKLTQPDPLGRLHNMMDQITLGESKGLLTSDESASLRSEFTRLDTLIQADLVDGLTTTENDDLERQLTVFNQQISDAMK
jgi:hypothetical protein